MSSSLDGLSSELSRASTPVGVGLSDPSQSIRRRSMLDVINRMRNTGVQGDVDLPEIAVLGQQSAGKSSLIESISGVTLPRASNTCTRCPTECRLSRGRGAWTCRIALRFQYDRNGQKIKVVNIPFGSVISDKDEVEDRLRRAQLAILSPSQNPQVFLEDAYLDSAELSFSKNCVILDITGPDVEDLSFIDLPGLIASSGSEGGGNDIAIIRDLAVSYIKKPSCLILLTVACETDFMNQGAYELAREVDPTGKRTVGVLTKPDRIPHGDEAIWTALIKNEERPLDNNWFCVKQPSAKELRDGMDWKMARQREAEYFSGTAHWTELDDTYQKYLRTENLVTRLSELLSELIGKRLPDIQRELEVKIDETRALLNALPPKPSEDPLSDIITLLHTFENTITQHLISGIPNKTGLLQKIRPETQKFRLQIRKTAPNFRPFERQYEGSKHLPASHFLWQEGEEDAGSEGEEEYDERIANGKTVALDSDVCYVDDVAAMAERAITRELPGNVPFVVQRNLIEKFTTEWSSPAQHLCAKVHAMTLEYIKPLIQTHFEGFGDGRLEQAIQVLVQDRLKKLLIEARAQVTRVHGLEKRPYTMNQHYLEDYYEKFAAFFKETRRKDTLPSSLQSSGNDDEENRNEAIAALARLGINDIKAIDLSKLLPTDEMEPHLKTMARVRAYFQVAYKRFVDNVPMTIDEEILQKFEQNLLRDLSVELKMSSPQRDETARDYARESSQNADRREDLSKKLERLTTASEELVHM